MPRVDCGVCIRAMAVQAGVRNGVPAERCLRKISLNTGTFWFFEEQQQ